MNAEVKLWDMSNAIAGFGIAQAVAFLIAFGSSQFLAENVEQQWVGTKIFLIFAGVFYIIPIYIIDFRLADKFTEHKELRKNISRIKIIGVGFIHLFAIIVVFGST